MKIRYKGTTDYLGVYEIDLQYLIYNRHNGRLEIEMATWEAEDGIAQAPYTDKIHETIEQFIWETNPQRNKQTSDDIREKGQLVPGIVTLDGVIIDGNRRALCLARNGQRFFDAVILPDRYDENEEWIVRLETQYQLGEDQKLEYGPLAKYLKVKRLQQLLGDGSDEEIGKLMGLDGPGEVKRLRRIMELMDEYLDLIHCPGLYGLLKDVDGGTKEGMFVDLYQDLVRFQGNTEAVEWAYDKEIDLLELKTVHFDFIRFSGDFSGTEKDYRKISHEGGGKKSFFTKEDMWKSFCDAHRREVDPETARLGDLDAYIKRIPGHQTRLDAAKARDEEWKKTVGAKMKENFYRTKDRLRDVVEQVEPVRLLERAFNTLSRIDFETDSFISDERNLKYVMDINRISYEMKRRFDRATRPPT